VVSCGAVTHTLRSLRRTVLVVAVLLVPGTARAGADLRIQFSALQRLLAEQMFTTEGRRYVRGTKDSACNFGYLEHPKLDATSDGRVRIRARFSGRSALDVFGHCIGFGDDFDLTITAVPFYEGGAIKLADVQVEPAKNGIYAGRVCRALAASLPAQFAYPAADEARRALDATPAAPGYSRRLKRFEVSKLLVARDALVLTIDFELVIDGSQASP
jgi:hypothetical protein